MDVDSTADKVNNFKFQGLHKGQPPFVDESKKEASALTASQAKRLIEGQRP